MRHGSDLVALPGCLLRRFHCVLRCWAGKSARHVHSIVREEGANEDGHLRGGRGSNPRGSTD